MQSAWLPLRFGWLLQFSSTERGALKFIYDYADSQTVWISDGLYSVHVMMIPGSDTKEKESGVSNDEREIIQSSGLHKYLFCPHDWEKVKLFTPVIYI